MTLAAAQSAEPTPDKLALSVQEVLARIPLSRSRLYEEMREGKLLRRKVGSKTLILVGDLNDWLSNLDTPSGQEAQS